MNSNTAWGIALRSRIVQFVREQGQATRREILAACGKEAAGQLKRLVETGELARVSPGVYEFREVRAGFRI